MSWYDDRAAPAKGVRVSFLDTATNRYRHVLLVYPYIDGAGEPTYEIVGRPQGGMRKAVSDCHQDFRGDEAGQRQREVRHCPSRERDADHADLPAEARAWGPSLPEPR